MVMEKAMVVLPDTPIGLHEGGSGDSAKTVVAADSEGTRVIEKSHQLLGLGFEKCGLGGTDFCRGRVKDKLGFSKVGLDGVLNAKSTRGVEKGGSVDKLLKGSCSLWAQTANKFGPLSHVVQQEGACVRRISDTEVVRLEWLEEQNKFLPLLGGPDSIDPGAAVQNPQWSTTRSCDGVGAVSHHGPQAFDPIQESSDPTVQGDGDCNDSLVEGVLVCDQNLNSMNVRKEAKRLFNIGTNLGVSSNEERIMMIEKLIDLEEGDNRPDQAEGDVVVDQ
ncbi:hypothetical protein A2U01_0011754 [Trifolium medium]|uniref:DUF4283 domain protein n=1 Tax=Trifolium medium TaxID=97028 RepID=A0A392MTM5_9FABA|nr:hypothetical protein [Trifolium medium]